MFAPVSASVPTSDELIAWLAIFDLVTLRALDVPRVHRLGAMSLDLHGVARDVVASTLFRPGSAVAVPASATHSAMNATIIAGDGRCAG